MSNRRYIIDAESVSISFHELVRELQLTGFSVEVLSEDRFRLRSDVSIGSHSVSLVAHGFRSQGNFRFIVDIHDPPGTHAPENVCEAVALWFASIISKAIGARAVPRFVSSLTPREEGGVVDVRRLLCG